MNINDKVWIRLTKAGVERWREAGGGDFTANIWAGVQLWHLIAYLGPGSPFQFESQMIVDNEIAIEDPAKKPKNVPVGPAMDPYTPMSPVPASPLTRTEIFLRLVDSFCRRPKGLEVAQLGGYNNLDELARQADRLFNTWGGK